MVLCVNMDEKKKISTFKEAIEYGDEWQRAYWRLLAEYHRLLLRVEEKPVE